MTARHCESDQTTNVGKQVEEMLREYGQAAASGGALLSAVVGGKVSNIVLFSPLIYLHISFGSCSIQQLALRTSQLSGLV